MKDTIADLTVAAALRDDKVLAQLGEMTGLTRRKLESRLAGSSSRTRLRTALAEELPLAFEKLSVLNLKQVRTWGLAPEIVRVWNVSEEVVERVLATVHGRTLVWRAFDPTSAKGRAAADEITSLPDDVVESGMRAAWDAVSRAIKFVTSEVSEVATEETAGEAEDVAGKQGAHTHQGRASGATLAALALDAEGAWSRPRQISQVLRALGLNVPQRLRTSTFQAMLRELEELGVAARLEDEDQVLTRDASSPGIATRVRLRRAALRGPTNTAAKSSASPQPSVVTPVTPEIRGSRGSARSAAPGPSRIAPVAPVAASPVAPIALVPQRSNYELALLRLRFLTAVPSVSRQRHAQWPEEFVAAAAEGLTLAPAEFGLLRTVSTGLAWGNHSPATLCDDLVKSATHHDLRALIEHLFRLNADLPEAAEEIAQQLQAVHLQLLGRPINEISSAPRPIISGLMAPHPPHTELPSSSPPPGSNARTLGALDDMFDALEPTPETNVRTLGALDDMFN